MSCAAALATDAPHSGITAQMLHCARISLIDHETFGGITMAIGAGARFNHYEIIITRLRNR
jgi:hypothetical protein